MLDSVARFEETSKANMYLTNLFLERTQNKAMGKSSHSFLTWPRHILISGKEEQVIASNSRSFGNTQ